MTGEVDDIVLPRRKIARDVVEVRLRTQQDARIKRVVTAIQSRDFRDFLFRTGQRSPILPTWIADQQRSDASAQVRITARRAWHARHAHYWISHQQKLV